MFTVEELDADMLFVTPHSGPTYVKNLIVIGSDFTS